MNKQWLITMIRSRIAATLDEYVQGGGDMPSSIDVEMIDVTTMLDEKKKSALGKVFIEWSDHETAEIKELIRELRAVAEPVGSQHGFWDLIFEMESAALNDLYFNSTLGFNSKQDLIAEAKKYLAEHSAK